MKKITKIILLLLVIALIIILIFAFRKTNTNEQKATETAQASNENTEQYQKYETEEYTLEYLKSWKLIGVVDENRVGPNSIYLGAVEIEIPDEKDPENTSTVYIKVLNEEKTLDEYKNKIREENVASPSEYYEETNSSEIQFKNIEGFQITSGITEDNMEFVKQDIFAVKNEKVYRITFFGTKDEINRLNQEVNKFINNFEIL